MRYRVEWLMTFTGTWMHYSGHWLLERAKLTACKQLANRYSVNHWRVVDKSGVVLYTFTGEKMYHGFDMTEWQED